MYKDGNFAVEYMSEDLMILLRYNDKGYCYTVINNSENDITLRLSQSAKQLIRAKHAGALSLAPLTCEIVSSDKKIDFKVL